jgi:hypothetical protein
MVVNNNAILQLRGDQRMPIVRKSSSNIRKPSSVRTLMTDKRFFSLACTQS